MKPFEEMEFHPATEKLVRMLCEKTQSTNSLFFRVQATFHLTMVASQMRVRIKTHDRGTIPVNMYALNLATSGAGKGFSSNILQNEVTHIFRENFMENFDIVAEPALEKLANHRATRKGTEEKDELMGVKKEYTSLGPFIYDFDDATPAAVKQMRHKLLMAKQGSMNMIIDEIGSNLLGRKDVTDTFLELYDVGVIKQKLTKVTNENFRGEEIIGKTPANLLMFGTPSKLLDGGKIEEELNSMLDIGYARRCFFSYGREAARDLTLTADQVYDLMTNSVSSDVIDRFAAKLGKLADPSNLHAELTMEKDVALAVIEYRLLCEREASGYPEHEEARKAEKAHRYFKALKVAGTFAFVDGSHEITMEHFENGVKLAEACGDAFELLMNREKNYVKLAKYIANCGVELTQHDLVNELPYYKGTQAARSEMMQLAIAYGYRNSLIIKKAFTDGVEFIRGETLKQTNLSELIFSYTTNPDMTNDYINKVISWEKLELVGQKNGLNWLSHHVHGGYRHEEGAIPGFNLLTLDVDGSCTIDTAKALLKGHKMFIYTTKSHTDTTPSFRIVLPTNFTLYLDRKDYTEFYKGVEDWVPFKIDDQCSHRCKKWLTSEGHWEFVDGEMFDVLPFIPKTQKNDERRILLDSQQQFDNLERWVINNTGDGNRNNMLHRFGSILVDAGFAANDVMTHIMALNSKLPDKLDDMEIMTTIMKTVNKRIAGRVTGN